MIKPFYKELGKILKDARIAKLMTQQEIADRLQIARQNVSTYENGIKTLDLDTFLKICDILQLDCNEVIKDVRKLVYRK